MIYQIYYLPQGQSHQNKSNTLFDIEYYLDRDETTKQYHSEIHCLPLVEGIVHFLKDAPEDFDYDQFAADAHKIQEIRGLLYERYNNKPKPHKEARDFHYDVFLKILRKEIVDFTEKYGLYINVD